MREIKVVSDDTQERIYLRKDEIQNSIEEIMTKNYHEDVLVK